MTQPDFARMTCDGCAKSIKFPVSKLGQAAKCPNCGNLLKLHNTSVQQAVVPPIAPTMNKASAPAKPFKFTPIHGVLGCFGLMFLSCGGCLGLSLLFAPSEERIAELRPERAAKQTQAQQGNVAPVADSPAIKPIAPSQKKWYEGGTLHSKGGLDWQAASDANKLATCADFISVLWRDGNLKPEIANSIITIDDIRPYAEQLARQMDDAFAVDPDPEQNRMLFTNQTVAGHAALLMVAMGWTK